jgi:hypothetical protein
VGLILLIVGIISCLIGIAMFAMASSRQTIVRENVRVLPDGGQERIVQQRDNLVP